MEFEVRFQLCLWHAVWYWAHDCPSLRLSFSAVLWWKPSFFEDSRQDKAGE